MSAPKHKKNLKWKIALCKTCNRVMREEHIGYGHKQKGHVIVPIPNEPFIINNLTYKGCSGRYRAASTASLYDPESKRSYTMALACFSGLVPELEKGVLKGKHWFVWSRRLSTLTIEHIGPEE